MSRYAICFDVVYTVRRVARRFLINQQLLHTF